MLGGIRNLVGKIGNKPRAPGKGIHGIKVKIFLHNTHLTCIKLRVIGSRFLYPSLFSRAGSRASPRRMVPNR